MTIITLLKTIYIFNAERLLVILKKVSKDTLEINECHLDDLEKIKSFVQQQGYTLIA